MNKGEEAIRTHHENGKLVSGFKGSDGSLYREVDDFWLILELLALISIHQVPGGCTY
ncbi:hypothetical protein WMQ48_08500 [Vibrio cidicii]|uniref:hypothetical protein n=1 Tax=Vibrio cidicii TaxID=1763883 RepID=UPI0018C28761|nr:hypothetical protein [Vibrio cidicii]